VCVPQRKPHSNFGAESGAGIYSFSKKFVNTHRDTYCHKLGEHRSSLHHRAEQVSDTKLDNIKHISCKVFGLTLSLLDFGDFGDFAVCPYQARVYA
jgi:hypothetical protein